MAHALITRPIKLTTTFPEDIRAKLDLFLWSELEQRVPKGAYQAFLVERIREFFASREVEVMPGERVRGSEEAIRFVNYLMENEHDK